MKFDVDNRAYHGDAEASVNDLSVGLAWQDVET
jgi:hypothetical protein